MNRQQQYRLNPATTKTRSAAGLRLVLAYHNITDQLTTGSDLYSVTTHNFIEHLTLLKKKYTIIEPRHLFETSGSRRPQIIITFDDGKKNNITQAFPILDRLRIPAVFFICSGFIGADGCMTAGDIRHMAGRSMIIGSHSHTHPDFGALSPKKTGQELRTSAQILSDLISRDITDFAYPYGNRYNMKESDKEALAACGFARAMMLGGSKPPDPDDPFRIPRMLVTDVRGTTLISQISGTLKKQRLNLRAENHETYENSLDIS
jgi:peptidoglycan/xylan/chitin deacetylase (PgdA/CDA1 family)